MIILCFRVYLLSPFECANKFLSSEENEFLIEEALRQVKPRSFVI